VTRWVFAADSPNTPPATLRTRWLATATSSKENTLRFWDRYSNDHQLCSIMRFVALGHSIS